MGFLSGNNYRTVIGAETALGSGKTNAQSIAWTEVTVLPDKCEMVHSVTPISTGNKTQTGLPTLCETKAGYQMDTVTLSGVLSHEHEIILKAFFKDAATPYVMDSVPTLDGYVIMQVWSDDTGTPYIADKAVGCQCVSFNITGTSGDMIKYEATFTSMGITRRASQAITEADPGTACTEGFNFGDTTATLNYGDTTHLKSFALSMQNNQVDDAAQFQNSNTRLQTIPMNVSGTLNYVTNYYDTAADIAAEGDLHSTTELNESITLANATKYWEISVYGQHTEYQRSDPDQQLFDNNVTERLIVPAGSYPITIAVTTI